MIQQQVEEIKFEQVYIQKLKHKAHKTNKIRDYLLLLKAYQQNSLFEEKDQMIQQMHLKFILNEQFWIQEIERKKVQPTLRQKHIQFLFMALDDGYYEKAAQNVFYILLQQLNSPKLNNPHLRVNYLIAKIQRIMGIFKRCRIFYNDLRQYYRGMKNEKKIRELYIRQIKVGLDNVDVVYDQYLLWQQNEALKKQSKLIYEQAKTRWQFWNAEGQIQFNILNQTDRVQCDSQNYLNILDKLETDNEKLRYLRIMCLSRHQLVNQYFEKMQFMHREDEDLVIKSYKSLLDIIQELQLPFLKFLVRRINKHTFSTQDQQYNDKWGENVQFFRQQISELINKPRLTPKTQQSIQQSYYYYWADVETSLVKDKETVCQIFQALLKIKQSVQYYSKYSNCMIRLGFYADAKQILKRSYTAFKYDYQAHEQYQKFISIYGTIEDSIQFRKLKMVMEQQANVHNENYTQSFKQKLNQNQVKQKTAESKKSIDNIDNDKMDDQFDLKPYIEKQRQKNKEKVQQKKLQQLKKLNIVVQMPDQNLSSKVQFAEVQKDQKQKQNLQLKQQDNIKKKMHTDSGNTLYIKGFPSTWKEQQILKIIKNRQSVKQVRLIEKKGIPQNYCYVQMKSEQEAQKQIKQNQQKNLYYIAISKPPSSYNEEKTLFLAGLPSTTTVDKIKNLFSNSEDIIEVRLKLQENKNIGYIDFSSSEAKNKAYQKLSHQNIMIDEKKIILKESNSRPVQAKKQTRVIILKQLSYKAKQKDIFQFFKDYNIEDLYIPEGQNGKSKGFAFVKFKTANQFYDALSKQKGVIKGRTFQIHKSDRDIQRPKKEEKQKQKQQKSQKINNDYFSQLFK